MDFEQTVSEVVQTVVIYRRRDKRRIEAALECGRHLIRAKDSVSHGEFMSLLERAGLEPRTAQRWMQLVRTGKTANDIRTQGGIQAALSHVQHESKTAQLQREIQTIKSQIAHCEEKTAEEWNMLLYWREQAYKLGYNEIPPADIIDPKKVSKEEAIALP